MRSCNVSTPGPAADDNHHADNHGGSVVREGRHANEATKADFAAQSKPAVGPAGAGNPKSQTVKSQKSAPQALSLVWRLEFDELDGRHVQFGPKGAVVRKVVAQEAVEVFAAT